MSSKIKSLIYLSCFILAAVVYEQSSIEPSVNLLDNNTEIAETHSSDEAFSHTLEDTTVK